MPSTQISSDGQLFVATISGAEISPTSPQGQALSFDLCDLFIDRVDGNVDFLQEGYGDSMSLGDIQFEATEDIVQYELQQFEPSDFVENKLSLSNVVTFVDSNFDPCLLDRNQDGVITAQDVQNLYDTYVNTTNPNYDLDNSGLVTENDRQLALQYVGTLCDAPIGDPPPVPQPVLSLDCFEYDGSDVWVDSSGNGYDFSVFPAGNSGLPDQNADGSIKTGVYYSDSDGLTKQRNFQRQGHQWEEPFSGSGDAWQDAVLIFKEDFIPAADEAYSWDVVFRMGITESNSLDMTGYTGPGGPKPFLSHPASCTWLGYQTYLNGGWHFGTFLDNSNLTTLNQYALFPWYVDENGVDQGIVPYRGFALRVDSSWNQPPNPNNPYVSQLEGGNSVTMNTHRSHQSDFLGLDDFGFNQFGKKCVVQFTSNPATNISKLFVDGQLVTQGTAGIALSRSNSTFKVGRSTGGGVNQSRGIDIYSFRAYNQALSEADIATQYTFLTQKYGV